MPRPALLHLLLAAAALAATAAAPAKTPAAKPRTAVHHAATTTKAHATTKAGKTAGGKIDIADMDTTCAPCKDFYQFVNGGWQARAEIPASYTAIGTGQMVRDRNQEHLHELLEEAVKKVQSAPKGSNTWKLGVYYGSCMDSMAAERLGAMPIQSELQRIAAIKTPSELSNEVIQLHNTGVNVLFRASSFADLKNSTEMITTVFQGGLGLPERDYYFKEDSISKLTRAEYVAHIGKMFELVGDPATQAKDEADKVMAIETGLAKVSTPRVELRDPTKRYHIFTPTGLDSLAPLFNWDNYFLQSGFPRFTRVNVAMPEFIKGMGTMLGSVPIEDWRTYLRWHVIDSAAPSLSSAFVNEDFKFSQRLTGAKEMRPRWKRCIDATDGALGEALGEEFVNRYFDAQAKARALDMVKNLEIAMHDRIGRLDWMGDSTKTAAHAKLGTVMNKIGYPEKWRDYSSLNLTPNAWFANRMAAFLFERKRNIAKIGQPVDRTEWGMSPPTVNAYYNPTWNEIVFPAGILQPPYFDPAADDALNYGSIGSVIGHEMTHGFDDSGSRYDGAGNLRDWWTAKDAEQFKMRTGRVVNQFDSYVAVGDLHVNGKLTLGENIADLGGLAVAYEALEKSLEGKPRTTIDGFTPEQRFFIGYARGWRGKFRPEALRTRTLTDPHSPNYWRVNGPLSNLEEFAKAFGCKAGDAMVRSDTLQAKIW